MDGCFWHGCPRCHAAPKANAKFWREKVRRNRARRDAVRADLAERGFRVVEIWEHEAGDEGAVEGPVGQQLESAVRGLPDTKHGVRRERGLPACCPTRP